MFALFEVTELQRTIFWGGGQEIILQVAPEIILIVVGNKTTKAKNTTDR